MPGTVTAISIANSALIKLGADRISSLTQDTKSAVLINALYAYLRDAVLRAHPWNFAIKRVLLAPNADTPVYEYTYTYDLPNDCLRVLNVSVGNAAETDDVDWVVEGRTILCDEEALYVRYIWKNTDESMWDHLFAEAFACRIGAEIAYALTQSSTVVDSMDKRYKAVLSEARSMDGAEGVMRGLIADTWTNSRK